MAAVRIMYVDAPLRAVFGCHPSESKEKKGLCLSALVEETPENEIFWASLLEGQCIRKQLTTLPVRVPVLSKHTTDTSAMVLIFSGCSTWIFCLASFCAHVPCSVIMMMIIIIIINNNNNSNNDDDDDDNNNSNTQSNNNNNTTTLTIT